MSISQHFLFLIVNFTNTLWPAFGQISFRQNITKTNCKHIKSSKTLLYKKGTLIVIFGNLGEIDTSYLSTKVVIKVFSYFSFKIIFFVKKTNLILKALIGKIQLELSTYVNWSNPREFQANLVILWQLLSLIGLTQIANVQLLRWHNNSCKKLNKNCEFFFHNFFLSMKSSSNNMHVQVYQMLVHDVRSK